MLKTHALLAAAVICALSFTCAVEAAPIVIMDATTHNGSFEGGTFGAYWDNATTNPPEWIKSGTPGSDFLYNGALAIQAYQNSIATNNTGETVNVGHKYTVSADLGQRENTGYDVYVRATENSDGTGTSVDLVQITHFGTGNDSNFDLVNISGTGSAAGAGLAGYFIQVSAASNGSNGGTGQIYFFDNVVVTSELVPEPGSMALLMAGGTMMLLRRKRIA